MRIDRWLSLLTKISKFDKGNDDQIRKATNLMIISFVLAFISIFVTIVIHPLVGIGTMILIVSGIALLIYRNKLRDKDINNYLRQFFIPLLHVLKAKTGGNTKLAANLDFRIPRKVLTPETSKINGRNLKLYSPKYIVGKLTMPDRAILEFVVSDDIKDFTWKKRSASGKTKYKSKTKFVHHCFIKLTLPKDAYTLQNEPPPHISVMEHNGSYLAKAKIKAKTEGKGNVLSVNLFLETMQQLYDLFRPPGEVRKRRHEDDSDDAMHNRYTEDDGVDVMTPYLWYGMTFENYDYDSFDYVDNGDYIMDDGSVTAFDS